MKNRGFRLPMASAIATVLYPNDFTVYDIRVCEMLGDFHGLTYIIKYDRLWDGLRNTLPRGAWPSTCWLFGCPTSRLWPAFWRSRCASL